MRASIVAALVLMSAAPAFARSPVERYEAPGACPSRAAFEERLGRHLDGKTDDGLVSLEVAIQQRAPDRFSGALELVTAEGLRSRRELVGEVCEEVAWALAFIGALMVSPDARPIPEGEIEGTHEATPTPAAMEIAPPPPVAIPLDAPPPRATVPRLKPAPSILLETGPALRFGPTPEVAFGARMRASRGRFAVALGYARALESELPAGRAQFGLAVARGEVCPLALGTRVVFEGCAGLEAGVLSASGARSVAVFWSAGGVAARMRVALGALFFAAFEGRGEVPFHRIEYTVDEPRRALYAVPFLTGGAHLALGVSIR